MKQEESKRFSFRATGKFAMFARPEFLAEPISYEVPPHSQARGLIESVYWKPEMFYRVHSVRLLSPVRRQTLYRNEFKTFRKAPDEVVDFDSNDMKTQRMSTLLTDVDYIFEADVVLSERGMDRGESLLKHYNQVTSRLRKGQHHSHPYFGRREYPAFLGPVEDDLPDPVDFSMDMGFMLYDRKDYMRLYDMKDHRRPFREEVTVFFRSKVHGGVMYYPTHDVALAEGAVVGDKP